MEVFKDKTVILELKKLTMREPGITSNLLGNSVMKIDMKLIFFTELLLKLAKLLYNQF